MPSSQGNWGTNLRRPRTPTRLKNPEGLSISVKAESQGQGFEPKACHNEVRNKKDEIVIHVQCVLTCKVHKAQ